MLKKLLFLNLIFIFVIRHSFCQDPAENKIFTVVEEMPQFPGGGESALLQYLRKNIKYPPKARQDGIEGTVYVTFLVDTVGKVQEPKILRGIGGGCDEEAIRVISDMPVWQPGKQNGKAVTVQYNLPIRFNVATYSQGVFTPHNSRVNKFYDKGIKFFEAKEYAKAIECFTQAIEYNKDIDSYYNRGICYKKSGDDISACNDWFKAKELGDLNVEKLLVRYCGETKLPVQDTLINDGSTTSESKIKIKNYPPVILEEGYEFSQMAHAEIKNKNNINLEVLYEKINLLRFDHCRTVLDFLMYVENT